MYWTPRYMTKFRMVVLALIVCSLTGERTIAESPECFTVTDSIEMTRIVDPAVGSNSDMDGQFQFSPDNQSFFIVTKKGDLSTDTLRYQLRLFSVDDVLDYVNGSDDNNVELSRLLVSFDSTPLGAGAPRSGGIAQARWLNDSKRIAFIGEKASTPAQVYSVHVETGQIRQLTDHKSHVLRFTITESNDRLLYVAKGDPPDWSSRNRKGYAVESSVVWDLLSLEPNEYWTTDEAVFLVDLSRQQLLKPSSGTALVSVAQHSNVWLSPNGGWAVALGYADDLPIDWLTEYDLYRYIGAAKAEEENNPAFSPDRRLARRYILIDIATGEVHNLLRSPVASGLHEVFWSADEQSVVLTNTHLPLEGVALDELESRRMTTAIVEVDLTTRAFTIVDYFAVHSGGGRIIATDRTDDSVLRVRYQQPATTALQTIHYTKLSHGEWISTHDDSVSGAVKERGLLLDVAQDMNTPPEIIATDRVTEKSRVITMLNPKLRHRRHAVMEKFAWTDKNGRTWEGGLLYPPDYDPNERYPLVIQTYGFSTREYLVDGPSGLTSAFAARPLSSMGIVVLQMGRPDSPKIAPGGPTEGPSYVAGFEGAVSELSERGIIDSERVGLIGWSRTGLHVSYAVAFSEIQFAAATIADSTSAGYLTYLYNYGLSYPGMARLERLIGAPFWGEHRELWLKRSPNMNAHRIHTPMRFETYGVYVNPYWDMFTIMQRHGRPAEMIQIPLAFHNLQRPQARYTSQQGNVDWFAYWLKGYVDPDPSKTDQYSRWRKLRTSYYETQQTSRQEKLSSSSLARTGQN